MKKIQFSKDAHGKLKVAKETHVGNDETIQRLTEDCERAKKDLRSHQRQEKAKNRNKTFQDIMDAHSCDQKLFYKLINNSAPQNLGLATSLLMVNLSLKTVKWEMLGKATLNTLELQKLTPIFTNPIWTQLLRMSRAVASFTVSGGQEFHFAHFFLKFLSIFLIFPQTLLIVFLILALRVGESSPTLEGPGYATEDVRRIERILTTTTHKPTPKVSCDEVSAAIQKLNNGKAADGKGIMAEHIKKASQDILRPLAYLFDLIFAEEKVPDDFKKGATISVPKKDKDHLLQENHRGITLTNTICKIFENVLLSRIHPEIETKYSCLQRGFTSNTTSLSAALLVSELMNGAKDAGKNLFLASLDASKAFDVVDHASLLRRLYHLDIQPVIWSILKHLYDGSQCQVKSRAGLSDPFTLHQGVHQGRVTSTDLYKCYIDPILHRLEENKLGARIGPYYVGAPTCANDIVLAVHNPNQLQEMLSELVIFSERERYKLHSQKSMVLPLCSKSSNNYWKECSPWSMNDSSIQVSNQIKHLGIVWNSTPSPKDTIDDRIQTGRRATYALMGAGLHGLHGLNVLNPKEAWKLIDTVVEPRYLYGLEIMGLTDANKKEITAPAYQKKTLIKQIHLPDRVADEAVYLLLGALPVSARIDLNQLTLFRMTIANESVESRITERQLALKSAKSKSWFVEVNKLLNKYGLPSAHDLLAELPSKHLWKVLVHKAVHNFWNDKPRTEAEQKVSLKYLNVDNCKIGNTYQVWDTVHPHQRDVSRATIKAKLLTGFYTLQANKAKFNQNNIDPSNLPTLQRRARNTQALYC